MLKLAGALTEPCCPRPQWGGLAAGVRPRIVFLQCLGTAPVVDKHGLSPGTELLDGFAV